MLVSGKFRMGAEYLFQAIQTKSSIQWVVCVPRLASGRELTSAELSSASIKAYSEFIIAAVSCNLNYKPKTYYGNSNLVVRLLKEISQAGGSSAFNDLFKYDARLGELDTHLVHFESQAGFMFAVEHRNIYVNSIKALKLEWIQCTPENAVLSDLEGSAKIAKIRTIQDLRLDPEYDFSWLYNSDGTEKKDYRLITTMQEYKAVLAEFLNTPGKYVSLDTEDTGTDFYYMPGFEDESPEICGFSFSWKVDQGVYVALKSEKYDVLDQTVVIPMFIEALKKSKRKTIAHSGMFDSRVFLHYNYEIHIDYDTLLLEFNLDPTVAKNSKALKAVTRRKYGHTTMELEDIIGKPIDATLVPYIDYDTMRVYGCSDSDYTLRIFLDDIKALPVAQRAPYKIDNLITEFIVKSDYFPKMIDTDLLKQLSDINIKDIAVVENVMHKYIEYAALHIKAHDYLELTMKTSNIPASDVEIVATNPDFVTAMRETYMKRKKKSKYAFRNGESEDEEYEPLGLKGKDLQRILFSVLKYPVTRVTDKGYPATNNEALEDLLQAHTAVPNKFLSHDVMSSINNYKFEWFHPSNNPKDDERILVSKQMFETYQYPFAYLLQIWRKLDKLHTGFFNKLLKEGKGKYFYSENSMTNAETARITSMIQTLIGSLKRLVVAPDDYYMVVADARQIEFRVMIGVANKYWQKIISSLPKEKRVYYEKVDLAPLVERLCVSWRDYHREGGAIFVHTTPDDMTKAQRDSVKAVHFSVPYGASEYGVAKERLAKAKTEEERQLILEETRSLLGAWRRAMYPLFKYLESKRDVALEAIPESQLPECLQGQGNYGKVTNAIGRCRYFLLNPKRKDGETDTAYAYRLRLNSARIRRQAGNYPIQSYARDIFVSRMYRLYKALIAQGYSDWNNEYPKVLLSMFIHDEFNALVHKSIHPFKMYTLISENCQTKFDYMPTLYWGISIVDNWYDGKQDLYEAPNAFVDECVAKYKANPELYDNDTNWQINPKEYILRCIQSWMFKQYAIEVQKHVVNDTFNFDTFLPTFKNYFLKPHLRDYCKTYREIDSTDSTAATVQQLEYAIMMSGVFDLSKLTVVYKGVSYKLTMPDAIKDDIRLDNLQPSESSVGIELSKAKDTAQLTREALELNTTSGDTSEFTDDSLSGGFFEGLEDLNSDATEDTFDSEAEQAAEYYLLDEADREFTYSVASVSADDNPDTEINYTSKIHNIYYDMFGRLIVDVNHVDIHNVPILLNYLKEFRAPDGVGTQFMLFQKHIVNGFWLSDGFDLSIMQEMLTPSLVATAAQ